MKWIVKILNIQPYKITCLWNDNQVRTVDLTRFIEEKSRNPESFYGKLKDQSLFLKAKCDGSTIYWENQITMIDYDEVEKLGPLDIDPDFLYGLSYSDQDIRLVSEP
jgi:hypothetical protein